MVDVTHFDRGDGTRLAVKARGGKGPALMFLPGYRSDMMGAKAMALDAWAAAKGRAMLRFDYSGCGASDGEFEDGTLAVWRDDALALVDASEGDLVLVGSSMGGWLMLLIALARPHRIKGLIGIAAAPDFTNWGYKDEEKGAILRYGRLEKPSLYSDVPDLITVGFWQSGEALRLLDRPLAIDCPIRLIHGEADREVPASITTRIAGLVRSADVQTVLIKDGDHRLSRPKDIALLTAMVELLLETL